MGLGTRGPWPTQPTTGAKRTKPAPIGHRPNTFVTMLGAGRSNDMKFVKGQEYNVASYTHDHMCVAVNKDGIVYISEPTTRNEIIGRIELTDKLVYEGRTKEFRGPTFKMSDGTLLRGHPNNFDLSTEYNQDKLRNRDASNSSNTKPEKLVESIKAMIGTLGARDLELAAKLAQELEKDLATKLADKVVDAIEAEASVLAQDEGSEGDEGEWAGEEDEAAVA